MTTLAETLTLIMNLITGTISFIFKYFLEILLILALLLALAKRNAIKRFVVDVRDKFKELYSEYKGTNKKEVKNNGNRN